MSGEHSSKTLSTAFVWCAFCVTLTWGVFRTTGGEGMLLVLVVLIVMTGATVSTIAIWAPWLLKENAKREPARAFEVVPLPESDDAQKRA